MVGSAAPLNPSYKEDEFRFYLEDTNAQILLLPPDGADEARRAAAGNGAGSWTSIWMTPATFACRRRKGRVPVAPPSVEDVALILHTSGSTGRPKRVPLSHANLSISAQNVAAIVLSSDRTTCRCA